jgi:hypothetical protein
VSGLVVRALVVTLLAGGAWLLWLAIDWLAGDIVRTYRGPEPRRPHDFEWGPYVVEDDVPAEWRRAEVTCRSCGEKRLVWHGKDLRMLNRTWLEPTPAGCTPGATP